MGNERDNHLHIERIGKLHCRRKTQVNGIFYEEANLKLFSYQ